MKPEAYALVILASGLSERFGEEDKLMADLNGKPVLQHVVDTAAVIPFAEQLAVIPKASIARRALLHGAGYTLIDNPNPKAGQGYSLQLAAKAVLAKGHKAVCVMLGDMPFVQAQHVLDMMVGITNEIKAISLCNRNVLPPVILMKSALEGLAGIDPKMGAKTLFLGEDVYKHPLPTRAAQDIDTPETLALLQGTS